MSSRCDTQTAIAAMVHAGQSISAIVSTLGTSQSTVLRVKKRLAGGKDPQASPPKRRAPILSSRVVGGLEKHIKVTPTKSLRRIAKEAGVTQESVQRVVRKAGWRSLRRVKVPFISAKGRETRVERSRGLINALKSTPPG